MRDANLLSQIARAAGAYTKEPLPTIELLRRDSITLAPNDKVEARQSLIMQRTTSVYYKDPAKQKRNLMRSKKDKAALASTDNWTYTKAEKYAVLDQQIRKGGAPGLAQAILSFDLSDPLDINVEYVADSNGDAICTGKTNGWLELLAKRNERNDVMYIRLLTSFGASQAARDRALAVALERGALESAQELLRNDAGIADHFLTAIRSQDSRVYTMFLTATTPLKSFYINQALIEAVGGDSDLVALLIAHGADGMQNNAQALCTAVNMTSLQDAAMILINSDNDLAPVSLEGATYDACAIADASLKFRFLQLLLSAGANANASRIQDELLKAVRHNNHLLVELLVNCGTSSNRNDGEILRLAVTSGQLDCIQTILQGSGSVSQASCSQALDEANSLDDLETFEDTVKLLIDKGVSQASLSKCLHDSVEKGSTVLAPILIERGAFLDYGNAHSVRQALVRNDFRLFGQLLEGSCEPSILCEALPVAMKIKPSSDRFDIMCQLLKKGVSGKELHVALQTAAQSAQDSSDYSLIDVLMSHNASVDFFDNSGNCVCTAAAQQDERALDQLCQGNPSPDTVSAAMSCLLVPFATADAAEYERSVGMMCNLLERGAYGIPVAQMLVKAAQDDHRQKALSALVQYRADANYKKGQAIEAALALPGASALDIICKGCKIDMSSFMTQLPNALKLQGFSLQKASLLANAANKHGFGDILSKPLLDEIEFNGCRIDVIKLLLSLGGSVDYQDGKALQHSITIGNVEVCHLLLAAGVKQSTIALAFPATSDVQDRVTRYKLMQALLEAGNSNIGQDQALIQASHEAFQSDLSHVELLLKHHASANFASGAAVIEAVRTKNLTLLKRLTTSGLEKRTLTDVFSVVRSLECTREERYDMLETLLQVHNDNDQISMALIEVVIRDGADVKTATLLLEHGASLEPKNGLAMQIVASSGSRELLDIFLTKITSQNCRDAGFDSAVRSDLDNAARFHMYQALLESGITQNSISAALLEATRAHDVDHALLALLIEHTASLDYDSGSALGGIVARADLPTLRILLRGSVSSKKTLDRSFIASLTLTSGEARLSIAKALLEKDPGVSLDIVSCHLAQIVNEADHELLTLVMNYQPDPSYNNAESLTICARAGDAKSTALLAMAEIPNLRVDQAFLALLAARTIRSKPEGLQTAGILLSLGVTKALVDRALLDGFDDPVDQLTQDLVDLLMPYNADVSGGDGKIFVDTAKGKHIKLFKQLATFKPDLNIVIPAVIRGFDDEEELILFLTHLEELSHRGSTPLQDLVIFSALVTFPAGRLLVKHLLAHGCPANSKIDADLDKSTGIETMTVLIWALSRTTPKISDNVIMEILEEGYNPEVKFETTARKASAALIASAGGRNLVLERLIALDIDIDQRDHDEHSALFYASRNGHEVTASIIVKAGALVDDGSLHEAARETHTEVVKLLLGNGHRADYPSGLHADQQYGRTPLEELCLKATPGSEGWLKTLQKTIQQLLPTRLNSILQSGGKTMLHLALENRESVVIARILLGFPIIWENINDSIFMYQDENGNFYSPTKYVELLFGATNSATCQQLTTLLRARKCKDRLYALTIEQPPGAMGLPDDVADAVNKQKRVDHEHREEMKRRDVIASHQRAVDAESTEREAKMLKDRHNILMRHLKDRENTEKTATAAKHALTLRSNQELERERQNALTAENNIRLQGEVEQGARRIANARAEQAAEAAHRQSLVQKEYTIGQAKLAMEQQLLDAREAAGRDEYKRQVDICTVRDASARYQAQQRAQYPNV